MVILKNFWLYHLQRRVLLLVFLIVGLIAALISIVWLIVAITFAPYGARSMNIILALDRLANAAFGGDGQETISSRAGRAEKTGARWACVLCVFLGWLQKNHCQNAIGD